MTLFEEALTLVQGPKRDAYGPIYDSFSNIALVWSVILKRDISASDVAKCMIGMKLVREANKHQHDNLVDLCGYTWLLNELKGAGCETN